jgi:hypothetical protein
MEACTGCRAPGGRIELAGRVQRAIDARSAAAAVQPDRIDGVWERRLRTQHVRRQKKRQRLNACEAPGGRESRAARATRRLPQAAMVF